MLCSGNGQYSRGHVACVSAAGEGTECDVPTTRVIDPQCGRPWDLHHGLTALPNSGYKGENCGKKVNTSMLPGSLFLGYSLKEKQVICVTFDLAMNLFICLLHRVILISIFWRHCFMNTLPNKRKNTRGLCSFSIV